MEDHKVPVGTRYLFRNGKAQIFEHAQTETFEQAATQGYEIGAYVSFKKPASVFVAAFDEAAVSVPVLAKSPAFV